MKDESMFARLYGYEEPVFREEHPVVEFETADGCTEYTVFAVLRLYKDDPWYDFLRPQIVRNTKKRLMKSARKHPATQKAGRAIRRSCGHCPPAVERAVTPGLLWWLQKDSHSIDCTAKLPVNKKVMSQPQLPHDLFRELADIIRPLWAVVTVTK